MLRLRKPKITGPYTQLPSYAATFTGTIASNGRSMSGRWTSNAGQSGTWSINETVSGSATGAANYVISGEQLNSGGGCAGTYSAEATRKDWHRWPTGSRPRQFSLVAKFYARNHKAHGICTYLVNATTHKTYAHASRFWNNS